MFIVSRISFEFESRLTSVYGGSNQRKNVFSILSARVTSFILLSVTLYSLPCVYERFWSIIKFYWIVLKKRQRAGGRGRVETKKRKIEKKKGRKEASKTRDPPIGQRHQYKPKKQNS